MTPPRPSAPVGRIDSPRPPRTRRTTDHTPHPTASARTTVPIPPTVIPPADPAVPTPVLRAPSVWATAQTSPAAQRKGRSVPASTAHPAKMLPAIAAPTIAHYTQCDLVLDPMCGIGTTLIEALHHSRHALGVEYEPHWVTITRAHLALAHDAGITHDTTVVHGDARHLPPSHYLAQATLVLTSPPCGPSTHGHITTTPRRGCTNTTTATVTPLTAATSPPPATTACSAESPQSSVGDVSSDEPDTGD